MAPSRFAVAAVAAAATCLVAMLVSASGGPLDDLRLFGYQPQAASAAVVTAGANARFTVLTPWVIRMEYSAAATFEDRATLAIVNRNTPVPQFTQSVSGGTLTITTTWITLRYTVGQPFSGSSLKVTSNTNAFPAYSFGDKDTGNLLGTIRSLDDHCTIPLDCDQNAGIQTNGENLHCAWAVISRNGWTTINDTKNFIMGERDGSWFSNRESERSSSDSDVYFFGHGMAFKTALRDFTLIAGRVPIPSRPLLGAWFTRWFDYDHSDVERLLDIFDRSGLPLDVLILDMNWHTKNAWTGFSWDTQLFPFPNATLRMVRDRGLMIGANIHDAEGVAPFEVKYDEFCRALGLPTGTGSPVLFQPLNATYMRAVEDILLGFANFDFYWTDWQQGGTNGGCNGNQLNPTFITDHVRWSDFMRRGLRRRSNNFARFGGLGAHRYPVGFTGDVLSLSWECFSYQPYFSVTASNVAYGYPSHDLVGPFDDHELHVRWMQFGAFSGVMRIHDRGMSSGGCWDLGLCAIVNVWTLPFEYFEPIREAMLARVELLPYIYREARVAYETGLNFVHALYIEWPTHNEAYRLGPAPDTHAAYMFGSDIMVAVVTKAGDSGTHLATLNNLWVPPGLWYDAVFGVVLNGPTTLQGRQYALSDIPMFIRAGAVIPRLPTAAARKVGAAAQSFTAVDWFVYPGATSGSGTLYEDDGATWDYIGATGFAVTNCSFQSSSSKSIAITVNAASVARSFVPAQRTTRFVLVGVAPLASVQCNGQPVAFDQSGAAGTWRYDGFKAEAVINCGAVPTAQALSVTASFIAGPDTVVGARGYARRAQLAKHIVDDRQATPGSQTGQSDSPGFTKQAGGRAALLSGLAPTATAASWGAVTGGNYRQLIQNAINELSGGPQPTQSPAPPMRSLLQLYDSQRHDMVVCGTNGCLNDNNYYEVKWTEGYQPDASAANAVAFNDWWSYAATDNWGDTSTSAPASGYLPAEFANGFLLSQPVAGQTSPVCAQVWVNGNDHMTVASSTGLGYARANGYTQVEGCIGYALLQPPSGVADPHVTALAELKRERGAGAVILAKHLLERVARNAAGAPPEVPDRRPLAQLSGKNGKHAAKLGGATQRAAAILQSSLV